ncbi:HAD family phosphatase [Thioclava sp. BHET1]|uniref:Haloacid dehalogenase n=1 Tax=Thioclava dalianensis TaxID=1185766 RepID=A0A074U547_9RHOB|nr:HAD-IA family hydrolase [Thioclava dalianensis]KEP69732.1 haloacid dehalogenase [Thioclava dalianensis]TMV94598.1 HAD family phosphatase [Thioclava sp. BHET1]SFM93755.1 2-haloacid dehalogenase [Thioclava dalianensis]
MVEAVIFDIGNVLIEWQPERYYDALMPRAEREAMFAEVDLHAMNDNIDRGAPFRDTIYDWAERYPKWRDKVRLWHDDWIKMASPGIERSQRLMAALQAKGIPVFSLTNFGIGSYDHAAQFYPFLRQFDRDFISGHMGVTKPDPKIYQMLESETGLSGHQLIFTDDRADNIATAHTFGWKTHLFEGPDGWAKRLIDEGLLSEAEAA